MTISKIWVLAQSADGAATSATLEMLTKARAIAPDVEAFVGGDAGDIAAALGEHGATTVYATGDLGGHLPGVAVAAAMHAVIAGGDAPDLVLFAQTTTAATSSAGCRSSSTARCSPTTSSSPSTATR